MFNFTKKNLLISFLVILVLAFLTHLIFFSPVPKSEKAQFAISKNKELSSKINKVVQKLFDQIKITINIVETKSQNPAQTIKINQKDEFQLNLEAEYFVKNNKYETEFLKKVLSHELMHVLSLRQTEFQSQNPKNWEASKENFDIQETLCRPNYFNLYGCFTGDSYLSKFYKQFWTGEIQAEYDQIQKINDKTEFNQKLNNWGQRNLKNFVSKQAFIDPEEDLAESFSVWMLDLPIEKLQKVAKEKVLFFENLDLKDFKKEFTAIFNSEFGNI